MGSKLKDFIRRVRGHKPHYIGGDLWRPTVCRHASKSRFHCQIGWPLPYLWKIDYFINNVDFAAVAKVFPVLLFRC